MNVLISFVIILSVNERVHSTNTEKSYTIGSALVSNRMRTKFLVIGGAVKLPPIKGTRTISNFSASQQ